MGYGSCKGALVDNVSQMLYALLPSTYDELAPKIEYWIEYIIKEQFTTPKDLAEDLSTIAWSYTTHDASIPRFLKEFRDAPNRPEPMRSFVDELCLRILRWFASASTDPFQMDDYSGLVPVGGGRGFVRAASFVGRLIERGLIDRELVRWHVVKPLTLYDKDHPRLSPIIRANAVYQLFAVAGDTLLQGLLEPGDVQVCFNTLDTQLPSGYSGIVGFNAVTFNEFRKTHTAWLLRTEEDQREATATRVPVEDADTPAAFAPQDLPASQVDIDGLSSAMQGTASLSVLRGIKFSSPLDMPIDTRISTVSSPTLSVSTISDLTPTELGEDTIGDGGEPTRHETFYLEDGNIEIACGHTIFRIHSPIVSFSSHKLRDMLSPTTILNAPTPEGCPRIVFSDSAEDFAVLLKMIYSPGFPSWRKVPEFKVFASLLRMATRYGFSDVREQLLHSLEGAYPTKWEAYRTASVLGEGIFGSPSPHPNVVLNLFLEQKVRFAIPLAAYRAALGGFSSLISDKPGAMLPRLTLACTIYGMETMRAGVSKFAYLTVRNMSLKGCRDGRCLRSGAAGSTETDAHKLDRIYDSICKEGKGDVFSSLSLGRIFCASCAKLVEGDHDDLRKTIWKDLPCILGVGKSWEEV